MSRPESEREPHRFIIQSEAEMPAKTKFRISHERLLSYPPQKMEEAIKEFEAAIEPNPELAESLGDPTPGVGELIQNAKILVDAKEYALAQSLVRKVLSINSRHPLAIRIMGDCLRAEGRIEGAVRCFIELLRIQESAENHFSLATAFLEIGQDEEASTHYLLAIEIGLRETDDLFLACKNLGNIAVRSGDLDGAEEFYNRAFTLKPQSDVLAANYGTLEIQRGNLAKAAQRFRDAVTTNPANDKAWVGLGIVHRQFGDLELSWGNMERALDLCPQNETALNLLVEWSLKDNQISQVIERLESYMMIRDQDVDKSLLLAKLLYCAGRYSQANLELERFLTLCPDSIAGTSLRRQVQDELIKQSERFE